MQLFYNLSITILWENLSEIMPWWSIKCAQSHVQSTIRNAYTNWWLIFPTLMIIFFLIRLVCFKGLPSRSYLSRLYHCWVDSLQSWNWILFYIHRVKFRTDKKGLQRLLTSLVIIDEESKNPKFLVSIILENLPNMSNDPNIFMNIYCIYIYFITPVSDMFIFEMLITACHNQSSWHLYYNILVYLK